MYGGKFEDTRAAGKTIHILWVPINVEIELCEKDESISYEELNNISDTCSDVDNPASATSPSSMVTWAAANLVNVEEEVVTAWVEDFAHIAEL